MNATDIAGYTYQVDTYCTGCIIEVLIASGQASPAARDLAADALHETLRYLADCQGIDSEDESTFDSSEWPKVIFDDQLDQGDEPDVCGRCHQPLAGEEGPDGPFYYGPHTFSALGDACDHCGMDIKDVLPFHPSDFLG